MSGEDLPTETACGECFAAVPLNPREWTVADDGANQLTRCEKCGALVFGVVGSAEYVQQIMLNAEWFVRTHRESLLH